MSQSSSNGTKRNADDIDHSLYTWDLRTSLLDLVYNHCYILLTHHCFYSLLESSALPATSRRHTSRNAVAEAAANDDSHQDVSIDHGNDYDFEDSPQDASIHHGDDDGYDDSDQYVYSDREDDDDSGNEDEDHEGE
ncbi:hypothetical protein O0I10_010361 [Lichtheimia ornata]|uniref:Uncharacterized protein n=1 Tax=Lichtheimia ornata TaxID=688661 RepID=A0AAD7UVI6_9FUNG|nr:uncharacterized protein O0I10_010361 [Lichtheimia ornata]KAJ8654025.1 hypothetical protein O0I10_010361 [Lichtheimia ornata]